MTRCEYCGKDNEDTSAACRECGTPFTPGAQICPSGLGRTPRTPLRLAIITGLGILLVCAALFFGVGRAVSDPGLRSPHLPTKHRAMYSFLTSTIPAPFIVLAAILPTFALCRARFQQRPHAAGTAYFTLLALAFLAVLPRALPGTISIWCVPALMFGAVGRPGGYYAGVALQLAVGAWLLVWFRPRRSSNETTAA